VAEESVDGPGRVRTRAGAPPPGGVYLCPSVGEYPIYDEAIYRVLREDERRNSLFRRAIGAVAPGATVLEIGSGPDLLWTLAAVDAGASRVYAVEVIEESARLAARAARTRPDGQVRVIAGESTKIALPERADVCIAEIIGCIGGSEGIAAVLADARRRHLTASALVIPSAVRTLAGAVSLLDLTGGDVALPEAFAPYVDAVFRQAGGPFDVRLYVGGATPAALRSTAGAFEDLNFTAQSYLQGGELQLRITRGGAIDGLLAWIELAVGPDDTVLDNTGLDNTGLDNTVLDSLAEDTNWLPVYIPFTGDEPLAVSAGDTLSLRVTVRDAADGIHPEYFFRGHLTRAGSGGTVAVSAESRYAGGPFRATAVHRRLFAA
jgi:protein arginine N-methyltransferase 1